MSLFLLFWSHVSFFSVDKESKQVLRDYSYHWSQILVSCRIQMLSLILLVTLGNPLLGKYFNLGRVGETSLKQNTSLRSRSRSSSLSFRKRSRKSKRSRHSYKKRRRRSTSSSSSSSWQSIHDYGRYKRQRQSPQIADILPMAKPVRNIEETPFTHSDNVVQQTLKDSGSDSEVETWSFARQLVKFLDFYHWSCVQSLRQNTLLLNH